MMSFANACRSPLILLALLATAVPGFAVKGEWRNLGPDGGAVHELAIAADSRVLYAGVLGGVYKSVDGGATWSATGPSIDFHSPVDSLAVAPAHPSTVYAGQREGLFKSVDGGQTWKRTGPGKLTGPGNVSGVLDVALQPAAPATVFAATMKGLYRSTNGGAAWRLLRSGLPKSYRALRVFIDPATPRRLFASIADVRGSLGGLYLSNDHGNSWRPIDNGPLRYQTVLSLAIDPRSPQTLYAGANGVYKITDGGATWTLTFTRAGFVESLRVHPGQSGVVYAGATRGTFRSQDGGTTWTPLSQGLPDPGIVHALVLSPASPEVVYAGVDSSTLRRDGVFKSTNAGDTWGLSSQGLSALNTTSLAVDPRTAGTLWVVANRLLFKSTDRGATWARMRPDPAGDFRIDPVVVDPLDSSTVYVRSQGGPPWRTRDGGQTWEALGLPPSDPFWKLVIDPQHPSTLYAAGDGNGKSTDGGVTWTLLPGEPGRTYLVDLVLSPSSPSTLYATGFLSGPRVLPTTDGGQTWTRIERGLPTSPATLAVDPLLATTVYTSWGGVIYRTTNGGDTWSSVSNVFRGQEVWPLAASPFPSGLLYAGVSFKNVYESADGGASWSPLGENPGHPYSEIQVDPLDPCRIYVATRDRGLLAFTKSECR